MSAAQPQPGGARAATPLAEAVWLHPMTVRHLPGVTRLERATSAQPWTRATFVRELEDPATRRYVVACSASPAAPRWARSAAVLGFGGVHCRPDGAHITTLTVAPERRRQGVGGRMLAWLLEAAVERGCETATLEVRAGNHVARRLYGRAGFVEAGVRPAYYRQPTEDAVIMWRELAAGDGPRRGTDAEGVG